MGPAGESVGGGVPTPPHARRREKEELSSRLVSGGLPSPRKNTRRRETRQARRQSRYFSAPRHTQHRVAAVAGRQADLLPTSSRAAPPKGRALPLPRPAPAEIPAESRRRAPDLGRRRRPPAACPPSFRCAPFLSPNLAACCCCCCSRKRKSSKIVPICCLFSPFPRFSVCSYLRVIDPCRVRARIVSRWAHACAAPLDYFCRLRHWN